MKIRVRSGDTLWYYSNLFMIPLNLILDSNRSINPSLLQPNNEITIPGFIASSYVIKSDDTFWKLATARNLSIDALLLLNQNVNPNKLKIGDSIHLPMRVVSSIVVGNKRYGSKSLLQDINQLKEIYPFITVDKVGNSVLGKPLHHIKIGKGKKKIQMNASFHANEWITSPILMNLINEYLLSLTNQRPIRGLYTMPFYNSVELSIVPMVNPDGVDLVLIGPTENVRKNVLAINKGSTDFSGWKSNIRGVDLNNQYPANWQIEKDRKEEKAPAPRDYPGDAPLTEPEAVAMANLARNHVFNRLLAFHTQGKEFYWGYEGFEPPESETIAKEFERVSGYNAIRYVDSHAGYKDWFIQEFRRPAFTLELGKGINPLPLSQYNEIYEEVLGIFLASLYM